MRKIECIILHCSDSDLAEHDNLKTINEWHLARGFNGIGYHFVITKDGSVLIGRKEEDIGAHCKGHNANSIGICLTGRNFFSNEQFEALKLLINHLINKYKLSTNDIYPHNHFDKNKTCPNFKIEKLNL